MTCFTSYEIYQCYLAINVFHSEKTFSQLFKMTTLCQIIWPYINEKKGKQPIMGCFPFFAYEKIRFLFIRKRILKLHTVLVIHFFFCQI